MMKVSKTHQEAANMKEIKGFTVEYKSVNKFAPVEGRFVDPTVYTFTCGAVDAEDAVRQLTISKRYRVDGKSRTRRFRVVRVYTGDGVGHCDCKYCQSNPSMSRKVRVIPSKMPSWMKRSFGKTAGRRGKGNQSVKGYMGDVFDGYKDVRTKVAPMVLNVKDAK
jgi:hypothetical protein